MDLSKYINALKEIPKRFGNVSYHYWDKQVSDNVAGALEEISADATIRGYGYNQHKLRVTPHIALNIDSNFAYISPAGDKTFTSEYSANKCKSYDINTAYVEISIVGQPSICLPAKFKYLTASVSNGKGVVNGEFAGCNAILPPLPANASIASATLVINCNYTY